MKPSKSRWRILHRAIVQSILFRGFSKNLEGPVSSCEKGYLGPKK
jgi:hypothetical protein